MENCNEEKSLTKVDNSIFAKMRRFFHGLFSKRKNAEYIDEIDDNEVKSEVSVEKAELRRDVYTEPKLFNYDNPQYKYDSTLGKKAILNEETENKQENVFGQLAMGDTGISRYFNNDEMNHEAIEEKKEDINNSEIEYNSNNEEKNAYENDDYEGRDAEKEELERKLMNYYASIKKVIQ